ncbi:IPT/TIG domain-containing protein [Geosporobacter subterraneus DSM 17957]|uniref:IPT/TIG domain-containing protein n=2 Tax=Geosporobacter TaxID=390805 RepID=A0A1M6LKU6_9FIRM|nr:IPT/TIG domain-containing protein [Geosporobacter subterraneus DSM 17957]
MMKKKMSFVLVVALLLNFLCGPLWAAPVYANVEPTIDKITIKEEVEVVNGAKVTKYQVIFNGYPLTNVDAIRVLQGGVVKKTLPKERFQVIDSANIAYIPEGTGQSIESIFGATGDVNFTIIRGGTPYTSPKEFTLPSDNFMKVDTINGLSPAAWPVTVIKGQPFTMEGAYFNHGVYKLGITTGDTVTNQVSYGGTSTQISVDTDTINIAAGNNQNFVFERSSGTNVEVRYIVKRAVNVANPLDLGDVSITPLQGTEGTIVRIKAQHHVPLLDIGTKVFIGGVEAKRNVSQFSDGTFRYIENGLVKYGLEVVVPQLAVPGEKPIVFRNFFNDTYQYPQNFNYVLATGSILEIIDSSITKAFTNEEKEVPNIRIRNAVAVNSIPNITITSAEIGTEDNLKYFKASDDAKAYHILYRLQDGTFIERKISLSIGLKASITNIPLQWDQDVAVVSARTDKVGQAGDYVITARTETIRYSLSSGTLTELNYIVEEAPLASQNKVIFRFDPDLTTPQVSKITPAKGPHDAYITATIEGQNFRVEYDANGVKYYPTVIIGGQALQVAGDYKYKVIQKEIVNDQEVNRFYKSRLSNGNDRQEITPLPTDQITGLVVLDSAGNIVDGQARKVGTKIKFTIPASDSGTIGFADVTVYNPNPLGGLGGKDTKENLFEYVRPADGALRPELTSVTPDKVAVGKQETVTLKGKNFQPGMMVTVDGELIQNPQIDIVKGTVIFKVPPGRPGPTFIQVINPDGGFASIGIEYIQTFSQPVVEKIIPNFGAKGNLVIIKGRNFYPANPAGETPDIRIGTKVYIDNKDLNKAYHPHGEGDQPQNLTNEFDNNRIVLGPDGEPVKTYGTNVAVVDNETIYFIIPDPKDAAKPFFLNEWLDVKVVNPDLGKADILKGFKILDVVKGPRVDSIEPDLGDYRGGNIAEITGDNFLEGAKVYFGSQEAQVYRRSNNARSLWVYVPAYGGDLGDTNRAVVPVTVLNSDGGSHTKYDGYTYVNPGYTPKITAINPKEGDTAGGNRILISGENFRAFKLGTAEQKLPAIYFGGVKADPQDITFVIPPRASYEEVEMTDLLIVEKTPPGIAGKVDVTVINYDGATVTLKNGFEYRSKQLAITQVLPNQGTLYGGSEVTIIGKDFVERGLHAVFGDQRAQGDILSGTQQVRIGDLIVNYNAFAPDNITLYYKNFGAGNELAGYKVYPQKDPVKKSSFKIVEEEEYLMITLPWTELQNTPGYEAVANWANENIKIEVKGKNLIVTRGLAIIKSVTGGDRITLLTPPSPEVGEKALTVYNQDGKKAASKFTYTNPYRPPVITKIIPTTALTTSEITGSPLQIDLAVAAPKGESPIIIQGQNFRSGVKVFIGNKEAEVKSKSPNDDELIVIVPAAAAGTVGSYLRILVVNQDGGATYGDTTELPEGGLRKPIYFRYIVEGSAPKITSVTPDKGPVTGGTKITIKGSEFKDEDTFGNKKPVEAYIGGIQVAPDKIEVKDLETIILTMPEGRVGKQTIEIVNYDFGRAIGKDIFTYISQPEVLSVAPAKIFTNDTKTEVTISGKMFQSGAKVVIGGKIIEESKITAGMVVNGTGIQGVDSEGRNRNVAVVDGKEAASVVMENEGTLKVKFSEATNLSSNDIIIINPDGGVSQPFKDFEYKVPVPNKPLVLEAIPGFESTVQLLWSESSPELLNAADRYEVYGKKDTDKQYTLIGDTKGASFLVKGLQPNTRYSFMVRALNKYGSAVDFAEVTVRTLSVSQDDKLKEKQEQLEKEKKKLEEEGKEEVKDGVVIKTIGSKQIPSGSTAYVIDFSLTKYKDQNKYVVAIPLSALQTINRQITITDGKASFSFLPKDLYTREVSQVSGNDLEDAHVRIGFERISGKQEESLKTAIPRTQRQASQFYDISFELQVGKNLSSIRRMMQKGTLDIKLDTAAYSGANKDKLFIGEYDPSQDKFNKLGSGSRAYPQAPGRYVLLSER